MIKIIYKGRKNLFVLVELCSNNVLKISEYNFKAKKWFSSKLIPEYVLDNYVSLKDLKPVTFQEFEIEFQNAVKKSVKKIDNYNKRIKDALNIMKSAELRHFLYEINNEIVPMLSEGMLKVFSLTKRVQKLKKEYLELVQNVEKTTNNIIKTKIVPEEIDFSDEEKRIYEKICILVNDDMSSEPFCYSIVKKGKYLFDITDDVVLDELPETLEIVEDENVTESFQKNDSNLNSTIEN